MMAAAKRGFMLSAFTVSPFYTLFKKPREAARPQQSNKQSINFPKTGRPQQR
jgi:hypothetical protein